MPQFIFQVGDLVRIAQHRATFRKSYESGWTEELFKITERVPRKISMYKIEDLAGELIKGSFYEYELQKVRLADSRFIIDRVIKTKRGKNKKLMYCITFLGEIIRLNSTVG